MKVHPKVIHNRVFHLQLTTQDCQKPQVPIFWSVSPERSLRKEAHGAKGNLTERSAQRPLLEEVFSVTLVHQNIGTAQP